MDGFQQPAPAWNRRLIWRCPRRWIYLGSIWVSVLVITLSSINPSGAVESHYAITGRAVFNQPEFYPIQQTLPPDRYRPVDPWMGKLILPTLQQQGKTDSVWMEVTHAPPNAKDLIGKQVRLEWSQNLAIRRDITVGTVDVKFDPLVKNCGGQRLICTPIA